jgi:hypothetical protein
MTETLGRALSGTMSIVFGNGVSHHSVSTNWTWHRIFDVCGRYKVVVDAVFLTDSSDDLQCLIVNLLCCHHKLVGSKGVAPLPSQCE